MRNGNIFTMKAVNDEKTSELFSQLGGLLGVSRGSDGKYHLADLCTAGSINKWAKNKPFAYNSDNFGYDPNNPSVANNARAAARKEKNQGLVLPTLKNAGVSSSNQYYAYLNYLAYGIVSGVFATSYGYNPPRGRSYSEPFRLRDFDGYNHIAQQPFTTGATLIYADGTQQVYNPGTEVNRFLVKAVRFWIQTGNNNVDITLADLLYGNDARQFYFETELFKRVTGIETEYFTRYPDEVLHSPNNISTIPQTNGFDSIDVELDAADDNTKWYGIIGINKYESASSTVPMSSGEGFVAPWTSTDRPFIITVTQTFHSALNGALYQGYYLPVGSSTWSAYDIPDTTEKRTGSNMVALSLKMKKGNAGYYVIGNNAPSGLPSGAITYMFRLIYAGQTSRVVVGTVVSSNITSVPSNNLAYINPNGDNEQVVYLRFDGILASVGDYIQYGILEVSKDGGATWGYAANESGASWSSVGMYVKRV